MGYKENLNGQSEILTKHSIQTDLSNGNDTTQISIDNTREAENAVLSSVLEDEVDFAEVNAILDSNDFSSETNKIIFEAMRVLHAQNKPIDCLSMCIQLGNIPRPDDGHWSSYLTNLPLTSVPLISTNLEYHLNLIKRHSQYRKMQELSQRLGQAFEFGDEDRIGELIKEVSKFQHSRVWDQSRLIPISAKNLLDLTPPETLWAGLIYPGCITQLNSEPGAGKSTICYNIAGLGARGKSFLGIPFTKSLKTLYIDLESPQWLQKQKIESICEELPENFYLLTDFDLRMDINDLIRLCRTENFDLIIFDTQSRALALEDENDNGQANRAATLLGKLTKETGVSIILIHHIRKGDSGKLGVYRGRGASAIAAAVDIVVNLEVLDFETMKLMVAKSRVPGVYQSIVLKKIGCDKFERVSTEEINSGTELQRIQNFIVNLLGNGEEWRTLEIQRRADREGFKERTVRDALSRLKQAGRVTQVRQGHYTLSKESINKSSNIGS